MAQRICSMNDCAARVVGRGLCAKHWQRWRKHGDPTVVLRPKRRPPVDPWTRIDTSSGLDACWPWTAGRDADGYGLVKIDGRQWRVPRWVLTQKLGRTLSADEVVRHSCDNPPCCNPSHLLPGTVADNAADAVERGRLLKGASHWAARQPERVRGTRNPAARLTEDQVRAIRTQYAGGARQVDLAADFGVTQGLISAITRRAVWAHLE